MRRLYLDDLCPTPEAFDRVYNYEEFVEYLERKGLPDFISFDHDLGEDLSGYDCAKYLVDYCLAHQLVESFFYTFNILYSFLKCFFFPFITSLLPFQMQNKKTSKDFL